MDSDFESGEKEEEEKEDKKFAEGWLVDDPNYSDRVLGIQFLSKLILSSFIDFVSASFINNICYFVPCLA